MTIQRLLTGAGAALLVAACAPGGPEWTGTVSDSAGVAMVSNTRQGLWPVGEEWTVQEELRIGSVEEEPEYQFGQIGFMAVASDGRIYVLDAQAQHVKAFSPDGEYLLTFGGPGGGPGELGRGAVFITLTAGDTVFIPDAGNQRVNRYAPDGTFLNSVPLNFQETGLPLAWQATTSGLIASQRRPLRLPNQEGPRDSMDVIVTLTTDGSVADTLMRFPSGGSFDFSGDRPRRTIFAPEPSWTLLDDGHVLFGINDNYRIEIRAPGDVLERVITMPFEQRPVTETDQQNYLDIIERLMRDLGAPPQQARQFLDIIEFGPYYPAFAGFQGGPRGSIWVQHILGLSDLSDEQLENFNPFEDQGSPNWDVFDREGRHLGVVRMPARFAPRAIVDDRIYGVWRDDLDVQYVMRLRIVGVEID